MRKLKVLLYLQASLLLGVASSHAAECGSLTIASMNWQSAEVLSAIDQFILDKGFGCDSEVIVGDTVPTITSMAEKGQPDVVPEGWMDVVPAMIQKGVDEGRIVTAANVYPEGSHGAWWVPKYFADAHPEIKTVFDALKHPELFPAPDDSSKGALYNGPQGWGGTVSTAQLFKAYKAEDAGFVLVDSGSAAGLDASIAKAYERKEPWLGFYWTPSSIIGKYEMIPLDPGVAVDKAEWTRCITVANCPDPKPAAWPQDRIYTLLSTDFTKRTSPDVIEYLNKRALSNDALNKLLSWMTDNQATGESGARHFLANNEDIWSTWVSADTATKLKAAL